MSEMSRTARRAMRAKIHRLTSAQSGKVDASDYGPEEVLDAGVKTGMRPVSRRAFKKGGKVVANEGKDAVKHAGKKPRNGSKHLTVDALVNRNLKDANESREGIKHIGGLKTGGRAQRASGGRDNSNKIIRDARAVAEKLPYKDGYEFGSALAGRSKKSYEKRRGEDLSQVKEMRESAPERIREDAVKTAQKNMANLRAGRSGMKDLGYKKGGAAKKNTGGPLDAMGGDLYGLKSAPVTSRAARAAGLKKGGRAARYGGGRNMPNMPFTEEPDSMGPKELEALRKSAAEDAKKPIIPGRNDYPRPAPTPAPRPPRKSGGKVWEGSAKDEAQDKKLAKKHGMSMKKWEASALDKKHDKQHSAKGLKRGGFTSLDGEMQTQEKVSGRIAKRDGGSLAGLEMNKGGRAKGKTNINIIIGTGQKQPMAAAPGLPQPPGGGIPVPVPPQGAGAPPMGGAPMPMPAAPPPMAAPPMGGAPMPRKRGGRTYRSYKDMDAGAGSGLGRLEKTEIQKYKK